jgi:hypothetical protein
MTMVGIVIVLDTHHPQVLEVRSSNELMSLMGRMEGYHLRGVSGDESCMEWILADDEVWEGFLRWYEHLLEKVRGDGDVVFEGVRLQLSNHLRSYACYLTSSDLWEPDKVFCALVQEAEFPVFILRAYDEMAIECFYV